MDELDDALNGILAIVGSEREWWDRIDRWVAAHRPKGKRPRKQRGITNLRIKWQAFCAYKKAPPGKKIEAECQVYKRLTGKVPNSGQRRQNRKRVRDYLWEPGLGDWIEQQLTRSVTDK